MWVAIVIVIFLFAGYIIWETESDKKKRATKNKEPIDNGDPLTLKDLAMRLVAVAKVNSKSEVVRIDLGDGIIRDLTNVNFTISDESIIKLIPEDMRKTSNIQSDHAN